MGRSSRALSEQQTPTPIMRGILATHFGEEAEAPTRIGQIRWGFRRPPNSYPVYAQGPI